MTADEVLEEAERYLAHRELPSATACLDKAEELGADPNRCAAGRWLAHMLAGEYASAWAESDAIQSRTPDDPQRFWKGEDLSGQRVILRCLHGFGDAVQFFRFLPDLRQKAQSITLEVPPRFVELASRFDGADDVITWGEEEPSAPPEWDVQVEINEVLPMLRLGVEQLPWRERYLHLSAADRLRYNVQASEERSLKVGVVWASGQWNLSRSLPFEDLAPILATSECEFWNLQGGSDRASWPTNASARFHKADACAESMLGLAAIICQLDLVISSDTLAAHLAGALGVPCWVMLQHAADWRWMHARSDSPWYRSLTLFRRQRTESWLDLTSRVAHALRSHVAGEHVAIA